MAKKQYLDYSGLQTYDEQIKTYIDTADTTTSTKLTSGTIIVKEAQHATSADSATNANNANHATSADSATTATKAGQLTTARTISLTGDASGSVSFNGTQDVSITVTVADDSHNHVISNIDGLQSALDGKSGTGHKHDSDYYAKSSGEQLAATLEEVKEDVDTFFKDADFTTNAKDTLKEIQTYINSDAQAAADMLASINGKADKATTLAGYGIGNAYTKTEVDTALSGKADSSHGTHVTFDSTNKPKMNGTAAFGTSTKVSRADHVHPTDTSRASQTDLDALESVVNGKSDSGHGHDVATTSAAGFMSADMVTKLNGIATGANKTTVDSSMSSTSTNPVQNKVVYAELAKKATTTALDGVSSVANEAKSASAANTQAIATNIQSINTHTGQISTLQGLVGDGYEAIPTASITALFS